MKLLSLLLLLSFASCQGPEIKATSSTSPPNPYLMMSRQELIFLVFEGPSELQAAYAAEEMARRDNPGVVVPLMPENFIKKLEEEEALRVAREGQ